MAIESSTFLCNTQTRYAVPGDQVKGTLVIVDKIKWETGDPTWNPKTSNCKRYRDNSTDDPTVLGLPKATKMVGTICYVISENKYYTWNGTSWDDGITGVQMTNKLVTEISSGSTDTQYPSAKCVYNAIQNTLGTISTALEDI